MPDIANGESVRVTGSKGDIYTLSRRGHVYSCTCQAWKHGKGPESSRRCKHLKTYLGDSVSQAGSAGAGAPAQSTSAFGSNSTTQSRGAASNKSSADDADQYGDLEVKPRRRGVFRAEMLDRAENHLNQLKLDDAEEALDRVGEQLNRNSIFTDTEGRQFQIDWQRWYDLRQRLVRERRQFVVNQQLERDSQNKEEERRQAAEARVAANIPANVIKFGVGPNTELKEDDLSDDDTERRDPDLRDYSATPLGTTFDDIGDHTHAGDASLAGEMAGATEKEWLTWFDTLPAADAALYHYLERDPDFTDKTMWQMFRSGAARKMFAPRWGYSRPYYKFNQIIAQLAEAGRIDRSKLLQFTIEAIGGVEEYYSKQYFGDIYARLKPTADEQKSHMNFYIKAINAAEWSEINWGLERVLQLYEGGQIDSAEALMSLSKLRIGESIFVPVITLIRAVVKKDKGARRLAAKAAAVLIVPTLNASSSKAAFDIVEKYGDGNDPEFVKLVCARADNLRGVQLNRAQAWLSKTTTPREEESAKSEYESAAVQDLVAQIKSCRPDILRAAQIDEAMRAVVGEGEIPTALPLKDIPVLSAKRMVERIDNINDLIYSFMRVIDRKTTGDEIERIVDALSRLCTDRPADFPLRVKGLKERAIQRLQPEEIQDQPQLRQTEPFGGVSDQEDLAALALVWTDGAHLSEYYKICPRLKNLELLYPEAGRNTIAGITINSFFASRMCALALQVLRQKALPSLAAPTHKGGWIDARVIGDRLRQFHEAKEEPNHFDTVQALLRLAPQFHQESLDNLKGFDGEVADAFRYALGADLPLHTKKDWLWGTAARARAPLAHDAVLAERFPNLPPNTASAPNCILRYAEAKNHYASMGDTTGCFLRPSGYRAPKDDVIKLPTYLFYCKPYRMDFEMQYFNKRPWEALVWPQSREAYFAGEARQVLNYRSSQGRYWLSDWEPLFDADTYAGGMARYLIGLGLSAKHEACVNQAIDALKQVIDDGRMDGDSLGEALALLLEENLIVLGRWFTAFDEVGKTSALHKLTIKRALEGIVTALHPLAPVPRALFSTLYTFAYDCREGIRNERTRTRLEQFAKKENKQAILLLELKTSPTSQIRQEAALHALERRVDRALRWQGMLEAMTAEG